MQVERRKEKRIDVNRGFSAIRIGRNFQVAKILNISTQGMALEIKTRKRMKNEKIEIDILVSDPTLSFYLTGLHGTILFERDFFTDKKGNHTGPMKQCSVTFESTPIKKKKILDEYIQANS